MFHKFLGKTVRIKNYITKDGEVVGDQPVTMEITMTTMINRERQTRSFRGGTSEQQVKNISNYRTIQKH